MLGVNTNVVNSNSVIEKFVPGGRLMRMSASGVARSRIASDID
jgi:hypothetical protein